MLQLSVQDETEAAQPGAVAARCASCSCITLQRLLALGEPFFCGSATSDNSPTFFFTSLLRVLRTLPSYSPITPPVFFFAFLPRFVEGAQSDALPIVFSSFTTAIFDVS